MTSGAPDWEGRAWRSTAGGRSVSRAAAAVQGASLRTLPLVSPVWLLSLVNPLAALLAGPPSLEILGETAARASGGESEGRRQRRSPRAASGPGHSSSPTAAPASTPSVHGLPSLSAPSAWTTARAHSAHGEAASMPSAALGRAAHGTASPTTRAGTGTPAVGRAADAVRRSASEPGAPAAAQPPAATSPLGAALDRITTSALAAAARPSTTPGATGNGSTSPSPGTDQEPPAGEWEATDSASPRSVAGPVAPWASAASSSTPAAADLGGGALGELVGRWQQSEQRPEQAPMSASRSPFAPLASALTTGFAEAGRSPDGAGDEVSLDQLQLALDELLRREAEQHGLEGGLV